MKDTIVVTKEKPKEGGKSAARSFAPSGMTARTPPRQLARAPTERPSTPTQTQEETTLIIDSDCEQDEQESPGNRTREQSEPDSILQAMTDIRNKLSSRIKTSGQNQIVKLELLKEMDAVIQRINKPQSDVPAQSTTARFNSIENDLKEIKAALLINAMTPRPMTYAQAATPSNMRTPGPPQNLEAAKRARMEKIKRERGKLEVTLTTRSASEAMQKKMEEMTEAEMTEGFQKAIQDADIGPIKIRSAKKAPNHKITLQCSTEKEAEQIRELNWEEFHGVSVVKQTFSFVAHGVSKQDIDFETQTQEEIKARIEYANCETITVKNARPLRKKTRNPNATTQSIVITTESLEHANDCITYGINIEHRHYQPERYIPQCQIRQCFNCQGYGHKADVCKKKPKCGKCAQEHETKQCKTEVVQCANCNAAHTAWDRECPRRQKEDERMEALKDITPSYFIC